MMRRFLGRFDGVAYAAMRLVVAFLFVSHGLQKTAGALGGHSAPITSLLGVAGWIETILGPLIGVGLFTSWAAFIACGELAVAYFRVHYPRGGWPVQNGGEITVALCFAFLYIATRGGGRWSLDALVGGERG